MDKADLNMDAEISQVCRDTQQAYIKLRNSDNNILFTIIIKIQKHIDIIPKELMSVHISNNNELITKMKIEINRKTFTNHILSQFEELQGHIFTYLNFSENVKKKISIFLLCFLIAFYYINSNILIKNFFTNTVSMIQFIIRLVRNVVDEKYTDGEKNIKFSKEYLATQIDLIKSRIFDDIKFFPKF